MINCQILFSGKYKKNITIVLSAELAQRVVVVETSLSNRFYFIFLFFYFFLLLLFFCLAICTA